MLFGFQGLFTFFLATSAASVLDFSVRCLRRRTVFLCLLSLGLNGFLTAFAFAATPSIDTPVDGVSARDVLQQMEANQADVDTLHMVVETEGQVQTGPTAGKALPKETQEMLIFTDPADGHRKVKITAKGTLMPVMYRVDLETYTMEVLMDSGTVQRTEFDPNSKAMIDQMIEGTLPPTAASITSQFDVTRLADQDKDQAEHLPQPTLLQNEEDPQAIEPVPTPAAAPKKGKAKKRWANKLGRKHRGHLKAWRGKRLRSIRMVPKLGAKAKGRGFAAMEQVVDQATGVPLETTLIGDDGKAFLHTRVVSSKRRTDGVVEPEETETVSDAAGAKVILRQKRTVETGMVLGEKEMGLGK